MGFQEQKEAIYDVITGARCYYLSVRLLVHPLAARLVYLASRLKLHPNHLSWASAFFSLICFYFFLSGAHVLALFFFYIRTVLDYSDGALARYTKQFSPYGKMLDRVIDEVFYNSLWLFIAYKAGIVWLGAYFLISVLAYRYITDYYVEPRLPELQGRRASIKKFFIERGIIVGCGVFTVIEFWSLVIFALNLSPLALLVPIVLSNLDLMYRVYEIEKYGKAYKANG